MSKYSSSIQKTVTQAMYKVFGWMATGIFTTGAIAYLIGTSPYATALFSNIGSLILLFILQFGLIILLTSFHSYLNYSTTVLAFLGYSALTGLTLSHIFLIYKLSSIIGVFFIAAGMFALMAIYGLVTKQDLRGLGVFLLAVLFGIAIISLINIFFRSYAINIALSFISVIVFAGITAYDIQRIRDFMVRLAYNDEEEGKIAIQASLILYINYINLFINLLRLLGKKKE